MKSILIVDDSALVRSQLRGLIEGEGFLVDEAKHGEEAIKMAITNNYSLITMDVYMPFVDGLKATEKIMEINPTPILMVSSLTGEDTEASFQALSLGALDYVEKPGTLDVGLEKNRKEILEKVRSLSNVTKSFLKRREIAKRKGFIPPESANRLKVSETERADSSLPIDKVILIGSSTGGPNLIEHIVASLPEDYPHPVVVIQHMPDRLTSSFAKRLDRKSKLPVSEVREVTDFKRGNIYIASGGTDLIFKKKISGKLVAEIDLENRGNFFKPSINETFNSALTVFDAKNIFAVILTGIGDDGAEGIKNIKDSGGYTVGESEETAIVYGMPKSAYEIGGLTEQLPFYKILEKISQLR
jgi:two-component system chemotaxis response regulator CheB